MRIVVNGEEREFADGLTVRSLVDALELGGGPVAVERNQEVVPRARHTTTILEEGDIIEVVHFVGGG